MLSYIEIQYAQSGNIVMEKKSKEFILLGVGLLCLGGLSLIFGDHFNNPVLFSFGKVTTVIGIVLYCSGRIGVWRRK